jgi:TonB family protein
MKPGYTESTTARMATAPEPVFLVRLEPWHLVFLRNLADLFTRRTHATIESSPPGSFWPDVFVTQRPPWDKLLQSLIYHVVLLAAIPTIARMLPERVPPAGSSIFSRADVIYYSPSEYLPPLDTGASEAPHHSLKPDQEYARQPVISVPPEPDNTTQTVVTPPPVKLERDLPLPNIVAWSQVQPAVPLQATANAADRHSPVLPVSVVSPSPEMISAFSRQISALPQVIVAPAPEANTAISSRMLQAQPPNVIQPPPRVEAASMRLGDVNIGHSEVISPAPALPVAEQRRLGRVAPGLSTRNVAVVPPAPSMSGAGSAGSGRLISLGIHPAALAQSVNVPSGNRRGTFAATPTGRKGGSGTPPATTIESPGDSGTLAGKDRGELPTGLLVGENPAQKQGTGLPAASSSASSTEPIQSAKAVPPASVTTSHSATKVPDEKVTDLDRQVFGVRKFYSMTLNMPNLNSAGGSWVIRFAELKEYEEKGDLSAPVATQKVDPAYPTELMRHNVQGTVTLRAIIRSDGSVGEVQVLRGIDDRLDEYAREALLQWHFLPALKDGSAVDLEAVVMIPFRPMRIRLGF